MSADRKRSRQKQASEQNQATVAAAAASSSAAAPRAKKIRVGVVRSPAAAAAADSADSADYQREVAALRLRSQRSLRTDQLIATISMSDSELAERIEDYREEMKRDAKRAVSMLDPNYQDLGGMTLLMHVISLFAERTGGDENYSMAYFDSEGVREHLESLIDRSDIGLQTDTGMDALSYLAGKVSTEEEDTDWFVVPKLIAMAKQRGRLDTRDAAGRTPFLRWCQFNASPRHLQLLIDVGCDIEATDSQGDTGLHLLVRSHNYAALESLALSHQLFERFWCIKNAQGQTPLDLARSAFIIAGNNPVAQQDDAKLILIYRLLSVAHEEWKAGMAPGVLKQLTCAVSVPDLARLVIEYLDGSGKEFKTAQMTEEEHKQADGESELEPAAAAAAAAANPAALDQ